MIYIKKKINFYHLLTIGLLLFIAVNQVIFTIKHYSYTPFLETDPSAPFFSSALELLVSGRASFNHFPGPPYYMSLALALLPLKLYTIVSHTDLLEFVYLNIEPILTYLQFMTMIGFLIGLYLISRTVVRLTRTEWPGLLFILAFFATHPENTRRIALITCEGFLIFISGLALYYFGKYLYDAKDIKSLYLSLFLLGIGFASKLTVLPLGIFMILCPFNEFIRRRIDSKELLISAKRYLFLVPAGFIAGVIVLGRRIRPFFSRMYNYAVHTKIHGQGEVGFDSALYLRNLCWIFKHNNLIFIIGGLLIVFLLYSYFTKKKDFLKKEELWIGLIGIISFTLYSFIAAKHLRSRFLITAFLLVAFSASLILPAFFNNRYLRYLKFVILIAVLVWAFNTYQLGMSENLLSIQRSYDIEALLRIGKLDLKNDKIVLSYCLPTKEYFIMRGNIYSFHVFGKVIEKYQPNFYRYKDKKIHAPRNGKEYNGEWDYAIITNGFRKEFMNRYSSRIVAKRGRFILLEK